LHRQLDAALSPGGEVENCGQLVHDVDAGCVAYVPAAQSTHDESLADFFLPSSHAVQVPPLLPLYPALHAHAYCDVLPCGEVLSAGQFAHVPEAKPVQPCRNFPAVQVSQVMQVPAEEPPHPSRYSPLEQRSVQSTHVPGLVPEQPVRYLPDEQAPHVAQDPCAPDPQPLQGRSASVCCETRRHRSYHEEASTQQTCGTAHPRRRRAGCTPGILCRCR